MAPPAQTARPTVRPKGPNAQRPRFPDGWQSVACLLYTSDAADERSSVDLGGRRIIKKKKQEHKMRVRDQTYICYSQDDYK